MVEKMSASSGLTDRNRSLLILGGLPCTKASTSQAWEPVFGDDAVYQLQELLVADARQAQDLDHGEGPEGFGAFEVSLRGTDPSSPVMVQLRRLQPPVVSHFQFPQTSVITGLLTQTRYLMVCPVVKWR